MGGTDGNNNSSVASGKRCRDPEDEVYVDNLNSHKRYLSEIMASSMNGLTVGETLSHNIADSPARDDMSIQYSPMSEDSDDSRYYDGSHSQPESAPTSPVSPCRYPKNGPVPMGPPTNPRQPRNSDAEGGNCSSSSRFPSSPSDICHSADLRRAALLRSVQMRAQPSPAGGEYEERFSYTYAKASATVDEKGRGKAHCEAAGDGTKGDGEKVVPCRSLDMKAGGDKLSGE